ncbi:MAG: prepilin-type N-terminal cleavage/methylation domain-containing protein [Planctomycetes bacterium]|nr:prepilin-type N-terminal cleavage/methylation domain-containing protein [Planctomycetota bacterium]
MNRNLRHPRRAGFTILEVVLAMAIFLIGMTAILGLLTFGSALSRTAHLRTSAATAVQAVTADLEETLFPLVDGEAGEPRAIEKRELHGLTHIVYSAVPIQNPERPLEYRVDVEIAWNSGGVQREKRFTTILLREVPFGERLRRRFVEDDQSALAPARAAEPRAEASAKEKKP